MIYDPENRKQRRPAVVRVPGPSDGVYSTVSVRHQGALQRNHLLPNMARGQELLAGKQAKGRVVPRICVRKQGCKASTTAASASAAMATAPDASRSDCREQQRLGAAEWTQRQPEKEAWPKWQNGKTLTNSLSRLSQPNYAKTRSLDSSGRQGTRPLQSCPRPAKKSQEFIVDVGLSAGRSSVSNVSLALLTDKVKHVLRPSVA